MISDLEKSFLPIAEGNKLVKTRTERNQRKGMDNDDDYYDEVDPDGNVVAKFHSWHHMSIYPPQSVNEGWEKFDLDCQKIAEGKNRS